jgi:hypothetical protein
VNDESELFSYSELCDGSPCLCQLSTMSVGPCVTSIDYVLAYTGFMGPANLVTSVVAELDDTSPLLQ